MVGQLDASLFGLVKYVRVQVMAALLLALYFFNRDAMLVCISRMPVMYP
jgi:hypothetical protein